MLPIMLSDDPLLYAAASALKMKLFKVDDNLLAIDEDGEKTLFAKEGTDDVIFTLVTEDETLQDKCSKMLISNVLAEINERAQHPEQFDLDAEQIRVAMRTKRFLTWVRRYFKNKE